MQFALNHGQRLGSCGQSHYRARHGFAVGIAETNLAAHRLLGLELRLVEHNVDFKVRLDIIGDPESRAITVLTLAENKLPTASLGSRRQTEINFPTLGCVIAQLATEHLCSRRIDHGQGNFTRRNRLGTACALELAAQEFHLDEIARSVKRPIGNGENLGIVDFAVVIEVFGNENATSRVLTENITGFRTIARQADDPIGTGLATFQYANSVAPVDLDIGNRCASLALCRPDQHFAGRRLCYRDTVRNKNQG